MIAFLFVCLSLAAVVVTGAPGAGSAESSDAKRASSICKRHRLLVDFKALFPEHTGLHDHTVDVGICKGTCKPNPHKHLLSPHSGIVIDHLRLTKEDVRNGCCVADESLLLKHFVFNETRNGLTSIEIPPIIVPTMPGACKCVFY